MSNKNEYGVDSIFELKFPYTVREKVGMYLGDAGQSGFFHTLTEILDNSIDEFEVGYGTHIEIKVNSSINEVEIRDYGRGIPFGINSQGVSALVLAMTTLHAGGKHKQPTGKSAYKYSSGINGVGASVVNGVSDLFYVKSIKGNEVAEITWKNGLIYTEMKISKNLNKEKNGTLVKFIPSVKKDEFDEFNVFEPNCSFNKDDLINKLTYIPYLHNGLSITLNFDGEIIDFEKKDSQKEILLLNKSRLLINETPTFSGEYFLLNDKTDSNGSSKKVVLASEFADFSTKEQLKYDIKSSHITLSFNFVEGMANSIIQKNFANGVSINGGKPDDSLKRTFKKVINELPIMQKKKIKFEIDDIFKNLTFVLSVKINQPSFSGQTKDKLNNPESLIITNYFMQKHLNSWINKLEKEDLENIIKTIELAAKAREAANKVTNDIYQAPSNKSDIFKYTSKLRDCRGEDPDLCELFIVEGDSAGGHMIKCREAEFQAYITLKGKPLNVLRKNNVHKIMKNDEIMSLAYALGGIGDNNFDIEKLKYRKIIILADADLDGYHISSLMLSFFFKFYPKIIERGYLFVGVAPLYKVIYDKNKIKWCWTTNELNEFSKKNLDKKLSITRNKGLGEMDSEDLFETTMNPKNRRLIKINYDSYDESLNSLMVFMGGDREDKLLLKEIMGKNNKMLIDENKNEPLITLNLPPQ